MIAASTAARISPATTGGKSSPAIVRNTVSVAVPASGVLRYTAPTMPTRIAAEREITTHDMAMRVA